jgi:hypothetical protein
LFSHGIQVQHYNSTQAEAAMGFFGDDLVKHGAVRMHCDAT